MPATPSASLNLSPNRDLPLGTVDASVIAAAERLDATEVATLESAADPATRLHPVAESVAENRVHSLVTDEIGLPGPYPQRHTRRTTWL